MSRKVSMRKRFSLRLLGKRGPKRNAAGANALPPSTIRSKPRRPSLTTAHGPHKVRVNVSFSGTSESFNEDGVSVITPVTGIPPDSPQRRRPPPALLLPPARPRPAGPGALYPGRDSPPSTPSEMKIRVPGRPEAAEGDDVSVMSSPGKSTWPPQRLAPPPVLCDDEDGSGGATVYEDDGEGSGGGGGGDGGAARMLGQRFAPPSPRDAQDYSRRRRRAARLRHRRTSWFTRTAYFRRASAAAFAAIDVDRSGDVTPEELYSGLLLLHLNLAAYAGAPACRPASRAYVTEIFRLLDTDDSGALSEAEFAAAIKILYSQVFTRIVMQWGLTLMIVPVVSQYLLQRLTALHGRAHEFWKGLDDELDPPERLLRKCWAWCLVLAPRGVDAAGARVRSCLSRVPRGAWTGVPFALLTLAQTSVALPFVLRRVEDFFRRAAHGDAGRRHATPREHRKEG